MRATLLIVLSLGSLAPTSSLLARLAPRVGPAGHAVLAPHRAVALVPRLRVPTALAEEDDMNGYRELGIPEDATYDEIMDAHMTLSERFADDPARVLRLDLAKDKVLDERLKLRMSGQLRAEVADSPFDAKPVERTPPWVIAKELAVKLLSPPSTKELVNVCSLIGGLTAACWVSPSIAGTALLINTMSAMGFIYNRGLPEVPRDDFGQVGEIRPMKPKPMALTCGVTATLWLWGFMQTKRLFAGGTIAAWIPEIVLRTSLISVRLMVAALVVKAHDIFDYPLGVPLPKPERR